MHECQQKSEKIWEFGSNIEIDRIFIIQTHSIQNSAVYSEFSRFAFFSNHFFLIFFFNFKFDLLLLVPFFGSARLIGKSENMFNLHKQWNQLKRNIPIIKKIPINPGKRSVTFCHTFDVTVTFIGITWNRVDFNWDWHFFMLFYNLKKIMKFINARHPMHGIDMEKENNN